MSENKKKRGQGLEKIMRSYPGSEVSLGKFIDKITCKREEKKDPRAGALQRRKTK